MNTAKPNIVLIFADDLGYGDVSCLNPDGKIPTPHMDRIGRDTTVHHSINGSFSIRRDNWKLELCPGSGGLTYPAPKVHNVEGMPPMQLYDLSADVRERTNVIEQYPDIVAALTAELETLVQNGRSTPGPQQRNNGKINIRRGMGVD